MKKPLVSLLIPCYNVEKKVHRLFDSILKQTYSHFQIIVVNDGSTDNTELVIKEYESIFQKRGIEFIYLYQCNGGVGKACETGLPYVNGEYLAWPDSDDFYMPNCIERLLSFLEENETYNIVRCNATIYDENDLVHPIGTLAGNTNDRFKENNLIIDFIKENNVYFAPICFMIRFCALKKANPELKLFHGRTGQNYQMLLPLLYNSKFGYIDECLSCYIIFKGSVSHIYKNNFETRLNRLLDKHNCVCETLRLMTIPKQDYSELIELAFQKWYTEKCLASFDYGLKDEYRKVRKNVIYSDYEKKLSLSDRLILIPLAFDIHRVLYLVKITVKNSSILSNAIRKIRSTFCR